MDSKEAPRLEASPSPLHEQHHAAGSSPVPRLDASAIKEQYSADEQKALHSLKHKLAKGLSAPDHVLMRFLRARSLDVQAAFDMYVAAYNWRKNNDIEHQYAEPPPMEHLLKLAVPQEIHKHDRQGRPVLIQKIGQMHLSTFIKFDPEVINHSHIHQMEQLMKACDDNSVRFQKRITQMTTILDLKGLGLSHRKTIQFMKGTAFIDKHYYPETLHQLIFINAPAIAPALWKIVKPMLDPRTQQKVLILGHNYQSKLHEIVAPEQLPKEYGGTCECPGGCVPEVSSEVCKQAFKQQYKVTKKLTPQLTEVVIAARGSHHVEIEVVNPEGEEVSYLFSTAKHDVGFAVEFHPYDDCAQCDAAEKKRATLKPQALVEHVRHNCPPDEPVSGSVRTSGPGICKFVFDNSFSRFTSKTLFFRVEAESQYRSRSASRSSKSMADDKSPVDDELAAEVEALDI